MSFNPSFPTEYQPTSTKDLFDFINNVVQYSTQKDAIAAVGDDSAFPEAIRGKFVLLHDGGDEYYGTDFDSPGWDNLANGNKGNDILRGLNNSRDFLRGGKDNDFISGDIGGDDFVLGDAGDDEVFGSLNGKNIIRGGKGRDGLFGGFQRDLFVGDFGLDTLTGFGGADIFVFRTDSSSASGLNNLTANAIEADILTDFNSGDNDYVVLPGIDSADKVLIEFNGADQYIKIRQPDFSSLYAAKLTAPIGFDKTRILVGDLANQILTAADGTDPAYTNNLNLLDSFGI